MKQVVQVRYFAGLREKIGCEGEEIKIDSRQIKLKKLIEIVVARHPEAKIALQNTAVAINLEVSDPAEASVTAGDEVAFLPPVGGGCDRKDGGQ